MALDIKRGLIPLALQTISLTNSTAVSVNSTTKTAQVLDISVETQPVRYRIDGTAPTLTTGVLIQKDTYIRIERYNGTGALSFQRSTGAATVHIQPYKYFAG
jgi:hypothetical protein